MVDAAIARATAKIAAVYAAAAVSVEADVNSAAANAAAIYVLHLLKTGQGYSIRD